MTGTLANGRYDILADSRGTASGLPLAMRKPMEGVNYGRELAATQPSTTAKRFGKAPTCTMLEKRAAGARSRLGQSRGSPTAPTGSEARRRLPVGGLPRCAGSRGAVARARRAHAFCARGRNGPDSANGGSGQSALGGRHSLRV